MNGTGERIFLGPDGVWYRVALVRTERPDGGSWSLRFTTVGGGWVGSVPAPEGLSMRTDSADLDGMLQDARGKG